MLVGMILRWHAPQFSVVEIPCQMPAAALASALLMRMAYTALARRPLSALL